MPQKVAVLAPLHTKPSFEIPKSVMQMWPSAVSSRFSGFKSLWRRQADDDMRLWGQRIGLGNRATGRVVPVDDALVVEVLQAQHDLGRVEPHSLLGELLLLLQVAEQFACDRREISQSRARSWAEEEVRSSGTGGPGVTSVDVVHDEVELVCGLEGVVELDQEGR